MKTDEEILKKFLSADASNADLELWKRLEPSTYNTALKAIYLTKEAKKENILEIIERLPVHKVEINKVKNSAGYSSTIITYIDKDLLKTKLEGAKE